MNKKFLAKIVSSCFHPVIFFFVMPFLIVYRNTASGGSAVKWGMFSFLFIVLAIGFMFFGRKKGFFSDYDISRREERYRFYGMLMLFGLLYIGVALYFRGIFFPLSLIALGIAIGIGVFDFFNRFIKASDHVAVACAFVLTIGLLYGIGMFAMVCWIVPLLGWSRISLNRHTKSEVIAGGVLGSLITLSTFFVGKSL